MLDLFVTATDSNIGKTFISAGLAATMQSLGYSSCVYKPVQTNSVTKNGFAQSSDLLFVKNIDPYVKIRSTYLLKNNASALIAAEEEGIFIDPLIIEQDYMNCSQNSDCTIIEGSGGISTPLSVNFDFADLVKRLNLPVLIIIDPTKASVNQILSAINLTSLKSIPIRGIIINNLPEKTDNLDIKSCPRLIEEYTDAKILGIIKHFEDAKNINPNDLITTILNGIDIESVFNVKISKLNLDF